MSIKGIRLENFRGFADASIKVKPLTVLLGANSSGKSSFGHAMAALAHAQSLYANSPKLTLTPQADAAFWPVDLGYLADLRKHGIEGPVYISFETSEGWLKWGFGLDLEQIENPDLEISYIEQPAGLDDRLSPEEIIIPSQLAPVVTGTISAGIKELPEAIGPRAFRRINEQQWRESPSEIIANVDTRGLTIDSVTHAGGGTNITLNGQVRREIRTILKNLTYLRATRSRPIRSYEDPISKFQQGISYGGEGTAKVLHQRALQRTDIMSPPVVATVTMNRINHLRTEWTASNSTLIEALCAWLRHMGLAHSVEAVPMKHDPTYLQIRVTLHDQQPHDITEVGFGISQLLPVLVAGLLQPPDSLFVVDLPEAHLHPRPQAALADFFCSLALSNRKTLVETHSEMFINQLRLRAEMTPELMENIAIYFVDEPVQGHCCKPRLISLKAEEEIHWPVGFLEEAWNIESQISAIRDARRK